MADRRSGRIRFKKKTTLTPIARWDVVPYQRIEKDATLNIGVVAFSKPGINYVKFTFTDGTNTHSYISREMTANPDTASAVTGCNGVWEYWATLRAEDYIAGPVTCRATVWGMDGGYNVLPDLTLIADSDGSVPRYYMWVDSVDGNDTTGDGSEGLPYKTISKATYRLNTLYGDPWGHVIYLEEGTYDPNDGFSSYIPVAEVVVNDEWLTITAAPLAAKENVILDGGGFAAQNIHVSGVSVTGSIGTRWDDENKLIAKQWHDNVTFTGRGKTVENYNSPQKLEFTIVYSTNCVVTNYRFGYMAGAELVRGCSFSEIAEDVIRNTSMVVDCDIDHSGPNGMDPVIGHPDAWQYYYTTRAWDNLIVYGVRVRNIYYQGVDCDVPGSGAPYYPCTGVAFVNVVFEHSADATAHYTFGWKRPASHFLMWNCTFVPPVPATNDHFVGFWLEQRYYHVYAEYADVDIRGCAFWRLGATISEYTTFTRWVVDSNNIPSGGLMNGYPATVDTNTYAEANDLDANLVPNATSGLRGKIAQLVPCDAAWKARSATTDIGAYEYQAP